MTTEENLIGLTKEDSDLLQRIMAANYHDIYASEYQKQEEKKAEVAWEVWDAAVRIEYDSLERLWPELNHIQGGNCAICEHPVSYEQAGIGVPASKKGRHAVWLIHKAGFCQHITRRQEVEYEIPASYAPDASSNLIYSLGAFVENNKVTYCLLDGYDEAHFGVVPSVHELPVGKAHMVSIEFRENYTGEIPVALLKRIYCPTLMDLKDSDYREFGFPISKRQLIAWTRAQLGSDWVLSRTTYFGDGQEEQNMVAKEYVTDQLFATLPGLKKREHVGGVSPKWKVMKTGAQERRFGAECKVDGCFNKAQGHPVCESCRKKAKKGLLDIDLGGNRSPFTTEQREYIRQRVVEGQKAATIAKEMEMEYDLIYRYVRKVKIELGIPMKQIGGNKR